MGHRGEGKGWESLSNTLTIEMSAADKKRAAAAAKHAATFLPAGPKTKVGLSRTSLAMDPGHIMIMSDVAFA